MDIKTAFLQGYPMTREVYIFPPKEACKPNTLWKLRKCVYGLADASLHWYTKVKEILVGLGGKVSKLDAAVFYWFRNQELNGILACHVDDFMWSGDAGFEKEVIDRVRGAFDVGKESSKIFKYVGLEVGHNERDITLQQQGYANSLSKIQIDKTRELQKEEPLLPEEKDVLWSKIGQMLWLARQSRPDLMFEACSLASAYKKAGVKDILRMNKLIKRAQMDNVVLRFQPLKGKLTLVLYADASFANLPDGGTQGGYLVLLVDESGHFSPICWNSRKVRRVVRSTLAGETLAMADGIDVSIFIAALYTELNTGTPQPEIMPIVCVTDNRSLCDAMWSNKSVSEKWLRLEVGAIKDMIETGQIQELKWTESAKQLADCLTKEGASPLVLLVLI